VSQRQQVSGCQVEAQRLSCLACAAALGSDHGKEYLAILRHHLLPVPEYCALASARDFQGCGDMQLSAQLS
jgi:hypothetical protein